MMAPTDDIDRIMAVMEAGFPPEYGEAWTRRQLESALLASHCHYLLIAADGTRPQPGEPCAGFALTRTIGDESELLLLAIRPEHRRRGLASALLAQLQAAAKTAGVRRLLLEMRHGNPAMQLYLKCDFVQIGERKNYYRAADGARYDALTFARTVE